MRVNGKVTQAQRAGRQYFVLAQVEVDRFIENKNCDDVHRQQEQVCQHKKQLGSGNVVTDKIVLTAEKRIRQPEQRCSNNVNGRAGMINVNVRFPGEGSQGI